MKYLPNILLTIICIANVIRINGQTDFRPGYIISHGNDTTFGFIDYRGELRNSKICVFKDSIDGNEKSFLPEAIKAYRFIDSKYYIASKINPEDEEFVFLEYLVNGMADLYFYRDKEGDHYLIKKDDGTIIELDNTVRQVKNEDGNVYLKESFRYIGILRASFSDCMQLFPKIDKVNLDHKSLISITKEYHELVCDDEECIVYEKKLKGVDFKFSPFIQAGTEFIGYEDAELEATYFFIYFIPYDKLEFVPSYSGRLGISMEMSLPRINEKLSFQTDLAIGRNRYFGSYEEILESRSQFIEVNSQLTTVLAYVGLKYTYPTGTLRPYLTFGMQYSYSFSFDIVTKFEKIRGDVVEMYEAIGYRLPHAYFGGYGEFGIKYYKSESYIPFLGFRASHKTGELYPIKYTINELNLCAGIYF